MRCKACNKELEDREVFINQKTKQLEDMCTGCRAAALRSVYYVDREDDSMEVVNEYLRYFDTNDEEW